jgi:signal transduction histidine kinase
MTGKGLNWTAAHLRAAVSPEDVRTAIAEATEQLGDGSVPASVVLSALEEVALDAARARTELRNATRLREVLLASVAHDLRNPLNTFAMSAGLLRDDLEGPDFDRTRALSLVSRMDRASVRMQGLIDDLLDASRVEAGSLELTCRVEVAATIVRAALAKAKVLVGDKGATLAEGSVVEDARVSVDRTRMVDALLKLVAVALKSTGEGGVIRLGVERLDDNVLFTVRATPAPTRGSTPPHDDSRGGLAHLLARGLVAAQGGQLSSEISPEGPRTVVSFPSRG